MNVAVSFNDRFVRYACVTLASLLENSSLPVAVHVLTADLTADSEDALRRLFAAYPGADLEIVRVDAGLFDNIDLSAFHMSKETFFRFLLPDILPSVDRLLYLDVDLVVRDDIAEVYETPLDGALAAAVRDLWLDRDEPSGLKEHLGLSASDTYVNVGVMLIDLAAWRREDVGRRAVRLMSERGAEFQYFDQDVLNLLLRGRVRILDDRWNFATWNYERQKKMRKNAGILHYTGRVKPWTRPSRRWRDCVWEFHRRVTEHILRTGRRPSCWRKMLYSMRARHDGT
jgi:lipopolysaccharide biosynthesis glycosyltransferase